MRRRPTRLVRFVLVLVAAAALAGIVVATAAALRFADAPCTEGAGGVRACPSGVVGVPYGPVQLEGTGGCGPALPYQYRTLNGALPAGLTLSSSGVISGTPTSSGAASFWVELSDEDPPTQSWCIVAKAEREFTITIAPGLVIQTTSLPGVASVGVPYSAPLAAMLVTNSAVSPPAGTVPASVDWSVVSGTLPPGLAISGGALAGTPTAEGTFQFVVQAKAGELTDTETLTLTVRTPLAVQASRPFTASGSETRWEIGVPFTAKLAASGGSGTYTWAVADGSTLPAGLTLAQDGTIAGRPTEAGTFRSTIRLSDSEGRTVDYQAGFDIASRVAVRTLRLRTAKVGRLYHATLRTAGGVLPTTWKVRGGKLPLGVRLASVRGVLTGRPRRAGTYRVVVEVTDALKVKSKRRLTLVVRP